MHADVGFVLVFNPWKRGRHLGARNRMFLRTLLIVSDSGSNVLTKLGMQAPTLGQLQAVLSDFFLKAGVCLQRLTKATTQLLCFVSQKCILVYKLLDCFCCAMLKRCTVKRLVIQRTFHNLQIPQGSSPHLVVPLFQGLRVMAPLVPIPEFLHLPFRWKLF